ncbi:hypothetical protein BsIDN1_71700 [Bacillus safensis]|uniref:DHHA2 domain-containing protein n=1 Tax=Bacillus safensis TaxID=561879 RepID=A0A5S9MLH4_BACIA|nr:hypothetical protein BsIDN1_71700 [Bacillus safensis]
MLHMSLQKNRGVDPEVYGLDMLKAGADLSQKTVQELITLDAKKEFALGKSKVEIAQVNTVDIAEVTARQADIEAKINEVIAAKGLDLFVLVITDILENDSLALALGAEAAKVEKAFNVTLEKKQHSFTKRCCIKKETSRTSADRRTFLINTTRLLNHSAVFFLSIFFLMNIHITNENIL